MSENVNIEEEKKRSHTGTRTRVARVKAEYPNHLDYMGLGNHGGPQGAAPPGGP